MYIDKKKSKDKFEEAKKEVMECIKQLKQGMELVALYLNGTNDN